MARSLGRTVVVFGAGATAACGGPLTNDVLPLALELRKQFERPTYLKLVEDFLVENFNLPKTKRKADDYPPLPLVLSLVDTALDRNEAFAPGWDVNRLRKLRGALEYAVFALLENRLHGLTEHYHTLLHRLYAARPTSVSLISLNYDIIADNALSTVRGRLPDYGCDISTEAYRQMTRAGPAGRLLKLHGSLNWLYCANCHRLDLGVSKSGKRTVKVFDALWRTDRRFLDDDYTQRGTACRDCETPVRPVLITPTHLKDYRNPHIARVWYEAARDLRRAERAIFIGYSLPDDDVEVIYLFKRGLGDLDPKQITVVEHAEHRNHTTLDEHPTGRRYRAIFGDQVDWQPQGFATWIADSAARRFAPPGASGPQATRPRRSRATA